MDLGEYREFSFDTWDGLATGWERWHSHTTHATAPVNEWLVRGLAPRRGETVLELAAGPGETGFAAAAALGEDGRLISTDFSPGMVDVARRRGTERELTNVEYRVMDAENVDLDDDSIDGVLCRFGYMLMADPAAALRETRRVLRAGGRVALSVWGPVERNPWAGIGAMMLVQRGHMPPPQPGSPGPFSMGEPEHVRALLESAGFSDVRIEEVPVRFTFRDVDEFVSWAQDTAGPFARVLRGLSDGEIDAMKVELEGAFAPFAADGGYTLPGVSLNAVAS